jgi:hypothetical protein
VQIYCADALRQGVRDLLMDASSNGPAVSLLIQFPSLAAGFDLVDIMGSLVRDGQLEAAEKFAAHLGKEYPVRASRSVWQSWG